MKKDVVSFLLRVVVLLALVGLGCFDLMQIDNVVLGRVTDASTGAPIDSARIYMTIVRVPEPVERYLADLTDVDGRYSILVSGGGIYFVEAEKEGYFASDREEVNDDWEVNFALVPVNDQ